MAKPGTCFLLAVLCVWLGCCTVEGRCSGKWARHSCISGNGKRSGTDIEELPSSADSSSRLTDLFLGASPRLPFLDRHKVNLDELTRNVVNSQVDDEDAIPRAPIVHQNGAGYESDFGEGDDGRDVIEEVGGDRETFSLRPFLQRQQEPSEDDVRRLMAEQETIRQRQSQLHQNKLRALWRKLLMQLRAKHSSRR